MFPYPFFFYRSGTLLMRLESKVNPVLPPPPKHSSQPTMSCKKATRRNSELPNTPQIPRPLPTFYLRVTPNTSGYPFPPQDHYRPLNPQDSKTTTDSVCPSPVLVNHDSQQFRLTLSSDTHDSSWVLLLVSGQVRVGVRVRSGGGKDDRHRPNENFPRSVPDSLEFYNSYRSS